jgi:uncharacterized membrane protein
MSAHHHSHDGTDRSASPRARRITLALLIPAAVVTLVAMVLLWPDGKTVETEAAPPQRVNGQVTAVDRAECPQIPEQAELPEGFQATACGTVTVRLTSGDQAGQDVVTDLPSGPGAITVAPGDRVVLLYLPDTPSDQRYALYDHQRSTQLWILAAAFALAVIAFGRWRGFTALIGLGITFAILLLFVVPAILDGRSPLLVAVVGSAAIMLAVLYLTHGLNLTTTVAVVGTLTSLVITALLSALATAGLHLTGVSDETSSYLNITHGEVNMRGLLLAGIVIGSLGVLDDVTVTQATAVDELARANPGYGFGQLYRSAERIGRAHIASVINTIVLAYAGASLPLLLLFTAGNNPVGEILTNQMITEELVRSAVGTIGLIAAVPVTTALAAVLARRRATGAVPVSPAGPVSPVAPAAGAAPDSGGLPVSPAGPSSAPPEPDPWLAFVDRRD